MRLIHTKTREIVEFVGSQTPEYGILSHTWEAGEATFQDAERMSSGNTLRLRVGSGSTQGFDKIRNVCEIARRDQLEWIWVDTCCIDKSSSSELTEAINSMFEWYASARICYAFLADLSPTDSNNHIPRCRWFTRGWTLQELIAPSTLKFYDKTWQYRGSKQDLSGLIQEATHVNEDVLHGRIPLRALPVGQRMSWAAGRQTTRPEDIAYCLLGLFDVNMPLIYGEGSKAFVRLQEEIIRQTNDLSVFLWRAKPSDSRQYRGIFAESPDEFVSASNIRKLVASGLESQEAHTCWSGFKRFSTSTRNPFPLPPDLHVSEPA
ncbi:heterokaryon incompatibility protein-domain-containing protein [Cercophora newfieldiana]|uniref:Heterokaryon incompatibility protein-domain-containing protein n=1 Tax=Cercophora newfieldiana TaxID=92897 RepID=A0AA40D184_9PEZI|nr:heterokaryon incompatibility protein-domain-containing protein [Cercophora newfieldiana]